jgi:hypothetical protein
MRTRPGDSPPERHRTAENSPLAKHVVAAGLSAKDAGSTPAASTIFYKGFSAVIEFTGRIRDNQGVKSKPVEAKPPSEKGPIEVVKQGSSSVPIYATTNRIYHLDPVTGQ